MFYAAIPIFKSSTRFYYFCQILGPSSHRATSGLSSLQRKQRSQSLERPAKTSHQDKMTGSLPRPENYNISDPDMIASKLAEQEYLQSLGKARLDSQSIRSNLNLMMDFWR